MGVEGVSTPRWRTWAALGGVWAAGVAGPPDGVRGSAQEVTAAQWDVGDGQGGEGPAGERDTSVDR